MATMFVQKSGYLNHRIIKSKHPIKGCVGVIAKYRAPDGRKFAFETQIPEVILNSDNFMEILNGTAESVLSGLLDMGKEEQQYS